jgi:hypothetical protein
MRLTDEAIYAIAPVIRPRLQAQIEDTGVVSYDDVRRVIKEAVRAGENIPQASSERSISMVMEALCEM